MYEASAVHEYFGREIPRQDLTVVNRIILKLSQINKVWLSKLD